MRARGARLARHEREFCADETSPLSLDELLALLGPGDQADERSRQKAIACYLSGSEGWRDAGKMLGGTFAGEGTGLTELKED
jgi:hypothetical protein